MRSILSGFLITSLIFVLASCGSGDQKASDKDSNAVAKDSNLTREISNDQPAKNAADTILGPAGSFIGKELEKWTQSFKRFSIDSFRMTQKTGFGDEKYQETADLKGFYELYKASLSFSPDSSQFIDLYSSGVMLEKKGKKVIASADVDQAITLCNLSNKTWKRIAFFGPSAGIEEAVWVSPTSFILTGMVVNENGERIPLIMLGDVSTKSFRWFEANNVSRSKSSKYEASGIAKLKIDEWE